MSEDFTPQPITREMTRDEFDAQILNWLCEHDRLSTKVDETEADDDMENVINLQFDFQNMIWDLIHQK